MLIIIEGENKTGKTTLAQHLVKKHKFEYVKCSQPKGDPYIEYMKILDQTKGKNVVIDRFAYGELVYGPIYRGKSGLTEKQLRNIELKAITQEAVLIYCSDTAKNIRYRFETDGETFAEADKTSKVLRLFSKVVSKANIPVVHHVIETNDILTSHLIDSIAVRAVKAQQEIKRHKRSFKGIIGNQYRPEIIFVAEKQTYKGKYSKLGQPFDFKHGSEYLFKTIESLKIPLMGVTLLNSDSPSLEQFLKWQRNSKVNPGVKIVSLGKKINKKLTKLGIVHDTLNSPEYEERYNGKSKAFKETLRDIVRS